MESNKDKRDFWHEIQFTEEEAIEIYQSKIWEDWSLEHIAEFQLRQRRLCLPFGKFHEAVEHVLGRPVWTHEFGLNYDGIMAEYEGVGDRPTMSEIFNMIPQDKLIIALNVGEERKDGE